MEENDNWYLLKNARDIDSPCLIIYKERVIQNILSALKMVDANRLRPHVKTNKCAETVRLMMEAGISKFKCATIAEAEMLAIAQAPDVLLAYQPLGPKLERFITLIKTYSATNFSCLADNIIAAEQFASAAAKHDVVIRLYIDLDIGMHRTGTDPSSAMELVMWCNISDKLQLLGLHAYDGHLRQADIEARKAACDEAFEPVLQLQKQLLTKEIDCTIIAGGSPTFPIHAKRKNVECSPGTFIYWDGNYTETCAEQNFVPAALVLARIISLPGNNICIDMGHKSIAAENDLQHRVNFMNAPRLKFTGQSEEHLVAEAPAGHEFEPGDILYGLPWHICPTVALYERAIIVENSVAVDEWKNAARDRMINV